MDKLKLEYTIIITKPEFFLFVCLAERKNTLKWSQFRKDKETVTHIFIFMRA